MFIKHDIDFKNYFYVDISGGKIVKSVQWTMVLSVKDAVANRLKSLKPYDPKADNSPKVILCEGIEGWIKENITGKVFFDLTNAWFEKDEDAMAFKLKWT